MKKKLAILLLLLPMMLQAAKITGVVLDDKGETMIGANVYWAGTTHGTTTNVLGEFTLDTDKSTRDLVTTYVGYHNDTTHVSGLDPVTIVLVDELLLDEVTITERKMSVLKSRTSAFDVETLDGAELCKAACCNLSEAFETNASVDVAYADAATGAKAIRLLGLSGTYVQLLSENTPGVRGLAQNFGMEYIPGPWMSSIQVSKGTSSVINGYEATTGQINVEFLKPQTCDPIAVNAMLSTELHSEVNVEGGWEIPLDNHNDNHEHGDECHHKSLYTGILAHYQQGFMQMDENGDGFAEMPLTQNANLANRWFFKNGDYTMQAFVRGLYDRRVGGQMTGKHYFGGIRTPEESLYGIDLRTWRVDGYLKNGIVVDDESGSSVGIVAAGSYHDQLNRYGRREWDASQANGYLNIIYQGNFEGPAGSRVDNDHRLSTGISLNFDQYKEQLSTRDTLALCTGMNGGNLSRTEWTPGAFAEYNLKIEDQLSLVAGLRGDCMIRDLWDGRKQVDFFVTPRLNIRYTPWEYWTIRASVGLGYRSPNTIADNAGMLPSSRTIVMEKQAELERALNTGASMTFRIPMGQREMSLTGEYYFTNFMNCVVMDLDRATDKVFLYNLTDIGGRSFAQNAQIEASMEILRGWTMTAAFRYTDVRQTTWSNEKNDYALRMKPLQGRFKGVITTSYQTPMKTWQFDVTAQFNGGGRMPDGFVGNVNEDVTPLRGYENSSQYYVKDGALYYKWYPQLMAQITKYFRTCSVYLGAENMTNFTQKNPVVGADKPYDPGFDASMAWGPITGWKMYVGFRWGINKE